MWIQHETLYIYISNELLGTLDKIKNIACFDLDWTLVRPQSGTFPKNYSDNIIMINRIQVLKMYISLNYNIVIFTNQKLTNREPLDYKLKRMNDVIQKLESQGINIILLMATADDIYRKPSIGMWQYIRMILPNVSIAWYTGDMAGRTDDHSDSDLQFAKNISIEFYLPERVFNA